MMLCNFLYDFLEGKEEVGYIRLCRLPLDSRYYKQHSTVSFTLSCQFYYVWYPLPNHVNFLLVTNFDFTRF